MECLHSDLTEEAGRNKMECLHSNLTEIARHFTYTILFLVIDDAIYVYFRCMMIPSPSSSSRHSSRATYWVAYTTAICSLALFVHEARQLETPSYDVQTSRLIKYTAPRVGQTKDGLPIMVDSERTLWMAGWHARFSQYYTTPPPIITWTPEAEEYVEQEYRRLHFPPSCSQVEGTKTKCTRG